MQFLAVSAFFIALNLIAAGVIWSLGTALLWVVPAARGEWWPWAVVGLAGVAVAVLAGKWLLERINRPSSSKRAF